MHFQVLEVDVTEAGAGNYGELELVLIDCTGYKTVELVLWLLQLILEDVRLKAGRLVEAG